MMNEGKYNDQNNHPSPFKGLAGVEYFDFEEDFIEHHIRCIPMTVRFKMDIAGIKLKLSEWSKFNANERIQLCLRPCNNADEILLYTAYTVGLIKKYTGNNATPLDIDQNPDWHNKDRVPDLLLAKAKEFHWGISVMQWNGLTNLQRFALLKLCRPGHENKNFPRAMSEFGLIAIK